MLSVVKWIVGKMSKEGTGQKQIIMRCMMVICSTQRLASDKEKLNLDLKVVFVS